MNSPFTIDFPDFGGSLSGFVDFLRQRNERERQRKLEEEQLNWAREDRARKLEEAEDFKRPYSEGQSMLYKGLTGEPVMAPRQMAGLGAAGEWAPPNETPLYDESPYPARQEDEPSDLYDPRQFPPQQEELSLSRILKNVSPRDVQRVLPAVEAYRKQATAVTPEDRMLLEELKAKAAAERTASILGARADQGQASREFTAGENAKDRAFQAEENRKKREARSRDLEAAAERVAARAAASTDPEEKSLLNAARLAISNLSVTARKFPQSKEDEALEAQQEALAAEAVKAHAEYIAKKRGGSQQTPAQTPAQPQQGAGPRPRIKAGQKVKAPDGTIGSFPTDRELPKGYTIL